MFLDASFLGGKTVNRVAPRLKHGGRYSIESNNNNIRSILCVTMLESSIHGNGVCMCSSSSSTSTKHGYPHTYVSHPKARPSLARFDESTIALHCIAGGKDGGIVYKELAATSDTDDRGDAAATPPQQQPTAAEEEAAENRLLGTSGGVHGSGRRGVPEVLTTTSVVVAGSEPGRQFLDILDGFRRTMGGHKTTGG